MRAGQDWHGGGAVMSAPASHTTEGKARPAGPWWRGFSPAFFAGIDPKILARARSEKVFYDALGVIVLLLACASGFTMCIAVSYMLHVHASHIWWLGVAWAAIVLGFERLILQM